jgi:hypothetical protein
MHVIDQGGRGEMAEIIYITNYVYNNEMFVYGILRQLTRGGKWP